MLWRYACHEGYNVSAGETTDLLAYTDAHLLGEWAVPAMQWACGAGIISGTSSDTLDPQGRAVRAQTAAMLQRFCERYEEHIN